MPKPTPQSLGGSARADALDPAYRREIARAAARKRWDVVKDPGQIPEAKREGKLNIGDVSVDCYVLKDGRRLVHKRAMARALGLRSEGGNAFLKTLSGKTVGSHIPPELQEKIEKPIIFKPKAGDPAHGFEATVLIEVCLALIDAKDALLPSQKFLARQSEIIVRSAAKLGIIALVDEATGYSEDKRRDEYRELWSGYIKDAASQWEAEFPEELFDLIYKLYNLKRIDPKSTKHPRFFPKVLRKYIYQPLAASNGAILEELEDRNPVVYSNGGRRYKLFQFLSEEIGKPNLRKHIWKTIGIGQSIKSKEQFDRAFFTAFPEAKPPRVPGMDDLFDDNSDSVA